MPGTRRRNKNIDGALRLLAALMDGKTHTARTAMRIEGHDCQEAAAGRHLDALEEFIPEVRGRGQRPRKRWFEWPTAQQTSPATVWALAIARSVLSSLRESLVDVKLMELLRDQLRRLPRDASTPHDYSRMVFARSRLISPTGINANTVDVIATCIFEQRVLTGRYTHFSGKPSTLDLEPYTLIPSEEGLFCYAHCIDSTREEHLDTWRIYNVARFEGAKVSDGHFLYPPADQYRPEKVFEHCFGIFLPDDRYVREPKNVRLAFAPSWETYLAFHSLHESQPPAARRGDGWFDVEMRVYLTYDLVTFLRGLGKAVRVLEPAQLRTWVQSGDTAEAIGMHLTRIEE